VDKIRSRIAHRVIFVDTSGGSYSLRTNPIVSTSEHSCPCLTTHKSIISRFSAVVVALVITSKRQTVRQDHDWNILLDDHLLSCFNVYAMSKASASAIVSLPNTDLVTRRDLCDDQTAVDMCHFHPQRRLYSQAVKKHLRCLHTTCRSNLYS
jgi:hypothetical protein